MNAIILGGTFDPVHIGHLHLADMVSRFFKTGNIIFLPSNNPPHKTSRTVSSAQDRLAMLALALEDTCWTIDNCEISRGGISYSIDTVREMKKRYGWTEPPGFVLGDDLVEKFSRWKEPEALSREVCLILASREKQEPVEFPYPHTNLLNPVLSVSSSGIRRALSENGAVRYLLTPGVYEYIRKKGLYGYGFAD